MAIVYNEKTKIFTISTQHTTYMCGVYAGRHLIYQPYCHLHVYNSIKIMVGSFVSTIILSLHYFSKNTTG